MFFFPLISSSKCLDPESLCVEEGKVRLRLEAHGYMIWLWDVASLQIHGFMFVIALVYLSDVPVLNDKIE